MAKEYVQLSYMPAGKSRTRTVWARLIKRSPLTTTYKEVNQEGDEEWYAGKSAEGLPIEQTRLIMVSTDKDNVTVKPAWMNPKYCLLEVIKEES